MARTTVAIAHDYLNQFGGAERVTLEIASIWPEAPIYTSLYRPESTFPEFRERDVRTSFLQDLPVDRGFRAVVVLAPDATVDAEALRAFCGAERGEHVVPEQIIAVDRVPVTEQGNSRELLISELSGKGTVQARARDAGIELDEDVASRVVERVKDHEHRGYHYEAAAGSFELLLRAGAAGWQVREFAVEYRPRAGGRSKVSGSIKGTIRAVRDMSAAMQRVSRLDVRDSPARSR